MQLLRDTPSLYCAVMLYTDFCQRLPLVGLPYIAPLFDELLPLCTGPTMKEVAPNVSTIAVHVPLVYVRACDWSLPVTLFFSGHSCG